MLKKDLVAYFGEQSLEVRWIIGFYKDVDLIRADFDGDLWDGLRLTFTYEYVDFVKQAMKQDSLGDIIDRSLETILGAYMDWERSGIDLVLEYFGDDMDISALVEAWDSIDSKYSWEKNIDLYNQLGDLLVGVACDIYHSLVLEISQVVDEYEEVC